MTFGSRGHQVPCIGCGILIRNASYCPNCSARMGRAPGGRSGHNRPGRTWTERNRRAKAVADWVRTYGQWCPGYQRQGHPAQRLTADHVIPVRYGGSETGELTILCDECNGRKADR